MNVSVNSKPIRYTTPACCASAASGAATAATPPTMNEQIETAYALKQITDAGVRVFF
jgi:hypothetical protein